MRHPRIAAIVFGLWEFRFPQLLHVTIGDNSVWSATLGITGEGATEDARWDAFAEALIAHWQKYMDATEANQSSADLAIRLTTRDHVTCVKRPKAGTVHTAVTGAPTGGVPPWEG